MWSINWILRVFEKNEKKMTDKWKKTYNRFFKLLIIGIFIYVSRNFKMIRIHKLIKENTFVLINF